MSTSTRSKPASPSSPEAGPEADRGRSGGLTKPVEVELEASRQRTVGWAIFGTIVGVLLVFKLGTVAVWGGYVMIAYGLYRAVELVQSFRHPAGKILISNEKIELPRALYRARPLVVEPKDVTAVYFLRKSVPWNRSAPVLIVELGKRALGFPRDWFASEADQRQVVHALLRQRGDLPED
jgi:hypothetical protein